MTDLSTLEVLLYEDVIGTLTRLPDDNILFAFSEAYVADEGRPTLSLSFKDAYGQLIAESRRPSKKLPFFSNLLPEGHMRDYLADRAAVSSQRDFYLLRALGKDLPGAVTIRPAGGEPWPETGELADRMSGGQVSGDSALRFSLAGVQLKFSAVMEASGGLTIPVEGVGGSWIVKLPSTRFPRVPENEYSMMSLARQVGIDVPRIQLIDVDQIENLPNDMVALEPKAFAVERFDRAPGGDAVHIEDFAQVFELLPENKYKGASILNIASVLAAETNDQDVAEFVRRLTFNTLIGNADMHVKNWSLIYLDRRTAALSPAYDFVSTIPYLHDRDAALKVSRSRRFDEFSEDELSSLASRAKLPQKLVLDAARETVERFREVWTSERSHLPLTREVVKAIEVHVETIPIAAA